VGDGGGELAGCEEISILNFQDSGVIKTHPWTDRDRADGESA
jgi:hypothetical protein